MLQWLELRQLPFRTWGFLDLRNFGISVNMAHMDMPLTGADVTHCCLFLNAKHLERVKNKQLRHEISEVLMSLYIRICFLFWTTSISKLRLCFELHFGWRVFLEIMAWYIVYQPSCDFVQFATKQCHYGPCSLMLKST